MTTAKVICRAAKKCGISQNRAHVALKTDKDFAEHVAQAREGIAEHLAKNWLLLRTRRTAILPHLASELKRGNG
jgi:hypothetical protein